MITLDTVGSGFRPLNMTKIKTVVMNTMVGNVDYTGAHTPAFVKNFLVFIASKRNPEASKALSITNKYFKMSSNMIADDLQKQGKSVFYSLPDEHYTMEAVNENKILNMVIKTDKAGQIVEVSHHEIFPNFILRSTRSKTGKIEHVFVPISKK